MVYTYSNKYTVTYVSNDIKVYKYLLAEILSCINSLQRIKFCFIYVGMSMNKL